MGHRNDPAGAPYILRHTVGRLIMDKTITGNQVLGDRTVDLRLALTLTYVTLAWMTIEGGASLWLGTKSHSLLLDSFGLDSVLELVSAAVLLWRLQTEVRGAEEQASADVERRASTIVGRLLFVLAGYVGVMSIYGLVFHHVTDTHESAWGILIGLTAKIGMPLLAASKLKVAARLRSKALRADAMEAVTCGYLSIVLIVGLAATRLFGWWWLDSVASLVLIPFLIKEGREAVSGECTCRHACE